MLFKNNNKQSNAILIKGARTHNLKNVDLKIVRNEFIVITGLSGSGKSTLAFDTLYAEGQRRYVESLSSYARQFLGRINKPEVDFIKGIPPAIAIEQKVNTQNPRSTVGTSTEIYDYLKLLFARIGKTYSPISGKLVKRHSVTDVVNHLLSFETNSRAMILCPMHIPEDRTIAEQLDIISKQGFSRVDVLFNDKSKQKNPENGTFKISDLLLNEKWLKKVSQVNIIIDRIKINTEEDTVSRMSDSIQTAFFEGEKHCYTKVYTGEKEITTKFSNKFEVDEIQFEEPTVHTFSFNNPGGACRKCEGFGKVMGIDEELVIPDKTLSVYGDAIACWKGEKMSLWKEVLVNNAHNFDFPIHQPYSKLTDSQKELLWAGNEYFKGLNDFFTDLEKDTYKIQFRVMLSRYRGKTVCPECKGTRLKKEASYIKIGNKSIHELVLMQISDLYKFFGKLTFSDYEITVVKRILIEIRSRLKFLIDVGLGYLTLNRQSSTLSGGESQRINLATSLGSSLVGSLYILDEPSIGLHSRDTKLLIKVLKQLQQIGNTVLVVEHDEDIIKAADSIIDIGPKAGAYGGEIVFQGNHKELIENAKKQDCISLTAKYITGEAKIEVPKFRRKWVNSITLEGCRENNLDNITVNFPLNVLTVVTGVSGSGKSSLVNRILFAALNRKINGYGTKAGHYDKLSGQFDKIKAIEFVNQNPIGKSSRSNPVTYIKAYDEIRKLFASQQAAVIFRFSPSYFSFNIDGGRCDECQGEGEIKVGMQFMADIHLTCESCKGRRFKDDVLEVRYKNKNIFDVLEMSIDEAVDFFKDEKSNMGKKIIQKLDLLKAVGLGYVKLGQSSSTLSGGESQRIKLASFLSKEKEGAHTLFIFDEPTTGLHFHDIKKLLLAYDKLIENGNTIIVIEHNMEVIKTADWIIDLGPEGGDKGGQLIFEGTPEILIKNKKSFTGRFLKEKI